MKYSDEFGERLYQKAHDDLIEYGDQTSQWVHQNVINTAENPVSNRENAAINYMLQKDPYAADREESQMVQEDGRWTVQMSGE